MSKADYTADQVCRMFDRLLEEIAVKMKEKIWMKPGCGRDTSWNDAVDECSEFVRGYKERNGN